MRIFLERAGLWLATLLLPASALGQPCTEAFNVLFERVSPSVVSIQVTKINKAKPQRRFETIVGSGMVIERDGLVLTNAHVVDGATAITVATDTGTKLSARLLGLDPVLDVALLRVDGKTNGGPVRLGDSSALRVGDEVVAIGSPVGLDQSMTRGIVSGLNRLLPIVPDQPLIQTDAPINPGNSGGPLVDRCGAVVGINTFISQDAQNVGFAVPINSVKAIIKDLREAGRVVRPWLGIQGRAVDARLTSLVKLPMTPGYLAEVVFEGSPAERAGIHGGHLSLMIEGEEYLVGGDIVTAVQGQPVRSHEDYMARVNALKPGQRVRLTIFRDGASRDLTLTVAERPRLPSDLGE